MSVYIASVHPMIPLFSGCLSCIRSKYSTFSCNQKYISILIEMDSGWPSALSIIHNTLKLGKSLMIKIVFHFWNETAIKSGIPISLTPMTLSPILSNNPPFSHKMFSLRQEYVVRSYLFVYLPMYQSWLPWLPGIGCVDESSGALLIKVLRVQPFQ